MLTSSINNRTIIKLNEAGKFTADDLLAVEEPLEIVIRNPNSEKTVSITMRTPGDDRALACGFLFTEGILSSLSDIDSISETRENQIVLTLNKEIETKQLDRNFYTTSSCGVCGKTSLDAIRTIKNKKAERNNVFVDRSVILNLSNQLYKKQEVFESTGGLHASALFTADGEFVELKEDVGRHNALDKLIGSHFLKDEFPLSKYVLLLSGRASFELIQKAVMAEIPFVAAIGAPSSLAVELAAEFNITLIGFLKRATFNIYTNPDNII